MKRYKGLLLVLVSFLLTFIFWLLEQTSAQSISYRQYSELIASIALLVFAWINFISTRSKLLDKLFDGMDKAYIYHKYLSIASILLIWCHDLTINSGREGGRDFSPSNFNPSDKFRGDGNSNIFSFLTNGKQLGTLSLYIFTGLVLFFLITYKLEYEKWKVLHKVMIIPYVLGVVHYYLDADYEVFGLTPYSLWMNLINAIGILSAIYSIFLYEKIAFKYKYKIVSIKEVAADTLEITGASDGRALNYKAGQFAFIKVADKNKKFSSHPFTISQAFKNKKIQFTIKVLGDHTKKLKDELSVGDVLKAAGPHGRFNYKSGSKNQVWIAGGIGVTPFRAFLQEAISEDFQIDFFYAYNNENVGAYVDEFKALKLKNNVRLHLWDTSIRGYLDAKAFEEYLKKEVSYEVYFCGPVPMRNKIKKDLKSGNFNIKGYHYEFFKFK